MLQWLVCSCQRLALLVVRQAHCRRAVGRGRRAARDAPLACASPKGRDRRVQQATHLLQGFICCKAHVLRVPVVLSLEKVEGSSSPVPVLQVMRARRQRAAAHQSKRCTLHGVMATREARECRLGQRLVNGNPYGVCRRREGRNHASAARTPASSPARSIAARDAR